MILRAPTALLNQFFSNQAAIAAGLLGGPTRSVLQTAGAAPNQISFLSDSGPALVAAGAPFMRLVPSSQPDLGTAGFLVVSTIEAWRLPFEPARAFMENAGRGAQIGPVIPA
jgi:hypothetical protein